MIFFEIAGQGTTNLRNKNAPWLAHNSWVAPISNYYKLAIGAGEMG